MKLKRICLVEDDPDLQKAVKQQLQSWYYVVAASNLREAWQLLEQEAFDLLLLDVSLPDGSGLEFCLSLRSSPRTKDLPIIFLTGKGSPVEKMMGFSVGADDYLTKPFEPVEARARIEARLKGKELKLGIESQVFGALRFDCVKQRLFAVETPEERDLSLTPFEFKLLHFLALREGQMFNRSELMKSVMEAGIKVNEETLYTHVSSIRRKLGIYANYLESTPRVGYRFVIPSATP